VRDTGGDTGITQVLNYYSLSRGLSKHVVSEALYVPLVEALADKPESYDLPLDMQVIEPMAYLSAGTVFTLLEKYDIAKALDLRAAEMFPGLARARGTNITVNQ
jgi:hypothetical protein